jgi:hypothetical protein
MQRGLVVIYRRFKGQECFWDSFTFEHATDTLSRNVGNQRPVCLTFQKNKDLIYSAEEAWSHALLAHPLSLLKIANSNDKATSLFELDT